MKNTFLYLLFISGLLFSTAIFCFAESEKQKVVFLDFKSANIDKEITSGVMENLLTSIIENNVFSVIERSQLNKIFEELKLTTSDDFTDETALEIGKLAKAKIVFLGSVTKLGSRITINMRGIEVETGTALFAKKITVNSENDLPEAIDQLAKEISHIAASQNGQEFAEDSRETEEEPREPDDEREGGEDRDGDRDFRRDRDERRPRERMSREYIKPVHDVSFSKKYGAEILKQVPIELEGEVRAESFSEKNKELISLHSNIGRGRGIKWNFSFRITRDIELGEIDRSPVIAKVVMENIQIPKKIQKESGLYFVCSSKEPGNYTVIIASGKFEAVRTLYIAEPMDHYYLPLSSFRVVQINRKPVKEYQSLTHKIMEGPISIHIEKDIFQVLNNETIRGGNYSNQVNVDEIGFFTYKLQSEKGYIANFDNPLDKTKISRIITFAHREQSMRLFEALEMKMIERVAGGIDRGEGIAGEYFFLQFEIIDQKVDHEWGASCSIPVDFDVSRFKEISFLVRARGEGAFIVAFRGKGGQMKFKPLFVPTDEWVRVTIPLADFESERGRGGDPGGEQNYLIFSINNFQLSRSERDEPLDRLRLEFDEIRFLP